MSEKQGWSKVVEVVKTVLEIIAIIVAGWWAYTRFTEEDAPSLVTRADLQGSLNWYDYSKDECQAEYEVEFRNIGKKLIDVAQVRISAWSLVEPIDSTPPKEVRLLDPLEIMSELPLVEPKDTDRLKHIYAPDERDTHGFSFIVKRSPGKKVLFKVDLWRKEDIEKGRQEPYWSHWRWDWACGEGPGLTEAAQSNKRSNNRLQPTPR